LFDVIGWFELKNSVKHIRFTWIAM